MGPFSTVKRRVGLVGERLHLLPFVMYIAPGHGDCQRRAREQGVKPIKLQ